ncbi:MAG: LytTR family DNA-binding domain-containing protein [Anaeromicrobium sp.]|jgi:DNA-binding LytR/AlgR family response regulator|uniref:LytR/AlgR family response regulator transcription factor n=1 Tax=Anaeromicrobium sp. TaxID=1929132 RepID=UPI0025D31183|nr:LytTR family DNA-binding domain-containing protein [Anaeromicrobium sp.]MCT4594390.1 LytTR family DNA-binding domain-containing protein [Anaeromicrobium sp.]
MNLKIVIGEDNEIFRKSLVDKVAQIDGFQVVYSTEDGEDFLRAIRKIEPEIIITDIDMPKINGIEVAKKIRSELPHMDIIFITSFSEHIREAVELYTFDYIEKPIDTNRLLKTLERLKRKYNVEEKLCSFKVEDGFINIFIKDIYMAEANKNKSIIYTIKDKYVVNHSLKEVEEILKHEDFFKSSRSYIVNIKKISSIVPMNRTSLEISFYNGSHKAQLSKKLLSELRKII